MMNTTTTALGTIGNRIDLAHQYAPGSYEIRVAFAMFGLSFEAHRFVRTDGKCACDSIYLYIKHDSSWMTDYVHTIDRNAPKGAPDRRALHLLAVAEATVSDDVAARFAAIELDLAA